VLWTSAGPIRRLEAACAAEKTHTQRILVGNDTY
jgi:hypothetical protein